MNSSYLKFLYSSFLDLIYPRSDIAGSGTLNYQSSGLKYLSDDNLHRIRMIVNPVCDVCGSPVVGKDLEEVLACQHCTHLSPKFDGNRSVFLLNRTGKQLVHELKYNHGSYLLRDIEYLIAEAEHLEQWVHDSVLVPVPLHTKRLRKRGYNQSEWLADVLKKVWGSGETQVIHLLKRSIDTTTQTRMDRHQRKRNIKGAFCLESSISKELYAELPITLIDDVFTTGATINECAKVLKRNGFKVVRSITLGHG